MRQFILVAFLIQFSNSILAQNNLTIFVKNSETGEPVWSAISSIPGTSIGAKTGENGKAIIENIPSGKQIIQTRLIGYQARFDTLEIPFEGIKEITLSPLGEEIETVVISSTRSSRTIEDIPTRVEFIAGEELDEKGNMKPGDIRMILSESTGIQVQTTSATSANASIRIQGLDGRYTQLLKDGFPLYSGAASGLGLLQIPPLDLKQVELIKGSASTLYGGGAIAGLVNLISKTPEETPEFAMHLNGTSGKGLDLNAFYSKRNKKWGTTIFGAHNRNGAYDPANIDLTAIPKFERFTLNPTLFFYPSERTTMNLGINSNIENRTGGDLHYINGDNDPSHTYFENNKTQRLSSHFTFDHSFGKCKHFIVKNSVGYFNRKLTTPGYEFHGEQYSSFTEISYANHGEKSEWIAGITVLSDQFKEKKIGNQAVRDYELNTGGIFVQNTYNPLKWFGIETGFRTDYVENYGAAYLPRLSLLFKLNPKLSSRLGGGMGYKAPTIFTEESERIQYKNVKAIDKSVNKLENSYGANWDVNYKTLIANQKISFSINQLFFYTYINSPLILTPAPDQTFQFLNINGNINTRGSETNVKLGYKDFKLFLGYTYTDSRINEFGITRENYLTPQHRINSVLFYEVEDTWKIGLEAYYFSNQKLSDGTSGKEYVIMGFMAEKLWEKFSIYINFENFLDARQTRFDNIYTGSISNPVFRDIYAPLDGFVINGGIKIKLH